jgi:glycerophosphoryl diester phosphodiesterase
MSTTPLIFSHRGNTRKFKENTLEAFQASVEFGVMGIETDVQMSKSGELYLFHDDSLERLMGRGGVFHDLSEETIKSFRYSQGEKIPTLRQLLTWLEGNPEVGLYLELKFPEVCSDQYVEKLVKDCLTLVGEIGLPQNSLMGSFDLRVFKYLNKYKANIKQKYPVFVIVETLEQFELAIEKNVCEKYSLNYDLFKGLKNPEFKGENVALWGVKLKNVDFDQKVFAWVPDLWD